MGKKPAIAWVGTFWFGVALAGGGCDSTSASRRTYNPPPMMGRSTVPASTTGTTTTVSTPPTGAGIGTSVSAPTGVNPVQPSAPATTSVPVTGPLSGPVTVNGFQTQPKSALMPPSTPVEKPVPSLAIPTTDYRSPPAPVESSRHGTDPKPAPPEIPPAPASTLPAAAATPPPRLPVTYDDGVGGMPPASGALAAPKHPTAFDPPPASTGVVLPLPSSSPSDSGVKTFSPPPGRIEALPPLGGADPVPFGK